MICKSSCTKAFTLILGVIFFLTAPVSADDAGDEVRAAKKIISVVYDDSGSTDGECRVYINYAMQALTALLNTTDELYLTYMSDPNTAIRMDMNDIEKTVETIRYSGKSGSTPERALNTALDTLTAIQENDPSTQFWLVVLTDGQIAGSSGTVNVQEWMDNEKNARMSNGTNLQIAYLAVGDVAQSISSDMKKGLYAFDAVSISEITVVMAEIANLVSARLTADNVVQVDDHTISFTSKLPLYSISILSQDSKAYVESAKTAEGDLYISRNIVLDAFKKEQTDLQITGNAAVIHKRSGSNNIVIPAGTYTVVFSEPVSIGDLTVQYEPAIAISTSFTKDGTDITDTDALIGGDKVDVAVFPVIPGTEDVIPDRDLPAGLAWHIEYEVNGTIIDQSNDRELKRISLLPGQNVIRITMTIPGFAPLVREIRYEIHDIHYGILTEQPDKDVNYLRTSLKVRRTDGDRVVFRITNNDIPLTKEQLKFLGTTLKVGSISCDSSGISGWADTFGKWLAACKLVQNDDGSYSLEPRLPMPFAAFLVQAGAYTVEVFVSADESVTSVGKFSIVPTSEDAGTIISFALFILGLLYLLYLILKKHFNGQNLMYRCYFYSGETGVSDTGNSLQTLTVLTGILSFGFACRTFSKKLRKIKVTACDNETVIISGASVGKCFDRFHIATGDDELTTAGCRAIINCMDPVKTSEGVLMIPEQIELKRNGAKLYLMRKGVEDSVECLWLQ